MSMDNEKDLLENQENEVKEEVAEEIAEDVVNEETTQDADPVDEAVNPEGDAEAFDLFAGEEVPEIPEKASISKAAVAAISVVITLIICVAAAAAWYFTCYNVYNANTHGYAIDIATGAKLYGMTTQELKNQYGLPKDMPDDTILEVATGYIPAIKMIEENYKMPVDKFKEATQLGDIEITDDTLWGDVQLEQIKKEIEKSEAMKAAMESAEESDEETDEETDEVPEIKAEETDEKAEESEPAEEAADAE